MYKKYKIVKEFFGQLAEFDDLAEAVSALILAHYREPDAEFMLLVESELILKLIKNDSYPLAELVEDARRAEALRRKQGRIS